MKHTLIAALVILVPVVGAPLCTSVRTRVTLATFCRRTSFRHPICASLRSRPRPRLRGRFTLRRRGRHRLYTWTATAVARPPRIRRRPSPSPRPRASPPPARPLSRKAAACLEEHNRERRRVRVPPLAWSRALEATAQTYATMLRGARLRHSGGRFPRTGENLYRTSRALSDTSWRDMHRLWVAERRWFRNGVFPRVAAGGRKWAEVGHYSAMVWRGTTEVGCAVAEGARGTTFVCHYRRQGNVMGERVY